MTPDETARVLAKCAAYDRRTIGRADVAAWSEALADLAVDDCLTAVAAWYSEHREFAMPADIRRLARPKTPPYWRQLPALPPAVDPEVGRRGIAACRAVLATRRPKEAS